jgi:hypothetical protein
MVTKRDCSTITAIFFTGLGQTLVTDSLEGWKESFRVMVLYQATSLCDRSIPQRDQKKVGVDPSLGEVSKIMDEFDRFL